MLSITYLSYIFLNPPFLDARAEIQKYFCFVFGSKVENLFSRLTDLQLPPQSLLAKFGFDFYTVEFEENSSKLSQLKDFSVNIHLTWWYQYYSFYDLPFTCKESQRKKTFVYLGFKSTYLLSKYIKIIAIAGILQGFQLKGTQIVSPKSS